MKTLFPLPPLLARQMELGLKKKRELLFARLVLMLLMRRGGRSMLQV